MNVIVPHDLVYKIIFDDTLPDTPHSVLFNISPFDCIYKHFISKQRDIQNFFDL